MESTPPPVTPNPSPAQIGGGLDFRTLAKFIGVLGVLVIVYGAYHVTENFDLPPPSSDSGEFRGWGNYIDKTTDPTKNAMGVAIINKQRASARAGAYKVIGVGAVIAFLAIGIDRSAKGAK
jgi:hypothetical protein